MSRTSRALVAGAFASVVALVAAGCSLLMGSGFGAFPEGMPSSSPLATFSEGSATIAIADGETIELDALEPESGIDSLFGSNVSWSNGDGWHLRVNGAGVDPSGGLAPAEIAFLTLDRVTDGDHWTTYDPSRCIVDIEVADETAIRGSATCKGVEWYDALGNFGLGEPSEVDEPPFDAEITFEATP
jgi:hypothetical protein